MLAALDVAPRDSDVRSLRPRALGKATDLAR
jgi:hypothetical protein